MKEKLVVIGNGMADIHTPEKLLNEAPKNAKSSSLALSIDWSMAKEIP